MIALVTAAGAVDLDADLGLLQAALDDLGAVASIAVWDDPEVDWAAFDAVVVRSTWDYHERVDRFREWTRHVASVSTLWNRPDVIEWSTDKRYLRDLAERGVPVVPTTFVEPSAAGGPLDADVLHGDVLHGDALDGDVVVKPSVGAGSNGAARFDGDPAGAAEHVRRLHAAGSVAMVQPYLSHVDERGETGLVYLGGRFSHAFRKGAILAGDITWEGGLYAKEDIAPRGPTEAELRVGEQVLAAIPPTAYARVDLLPGPDGPVVLELELVEPSLYLHLDPGAPRRAAEVFAGLARS